MKVRDFKEMLEDLDDDLDVRIMMQQSWPFECSIDSLVLASEIPAGDNFDEDEPAPEHYKPAGRDFGSKDDGPDDCLYIVEGSQLGYGTRGAWLVR